MANAQILILVTSPTEVPAEVFQGAVERAVRASGLGLGPWTYDATAVTLRREGTLTERVVGGPWDGLELTSGTPLSAATRRAVISAFRQNISGLRDGTVDSEIMGVHAAVRQSLASRGELRVAFRTTRNAISWDRGVPRPIELSQTGQTAGIGWGVLAAIGGLALIVARGNPSKGLSGWRGRRRRSRRWGRR